MDIDGEGDDVRLGMKIRRHAAQPQAEIELLRLRIVADAAVDHHAGAAAAGEIGEHHLAEDAAPHVAARVDDDDVAGPRVVEDVTVELLLGVGILAVAV